jgi:dTDP-4-dehydrorhamnose 3,5-epimerase
MEDFKTIQGGISVDDRGSLRFINDFDPMTYGVRRFYQVENHEQGFIRAWHGHRREAKFVYVPRGSILLGAVKLDSHSDKLTGNINKFILSDKQPKTIYIPPGYSNGFKTLEKDTIVIFFSTSTLEESKGDDIRADYNVINIWDKDYR